MYLLPADGQPDYITDQQLRGRKIMLETPIPVFNCPTRRTPAEGYDQIRGWIRSDYAANAGDMGFHHRGGPDRGRLQFDKRGYWGGSEPVLLTGIMYLRSEVKMADVSDGTSNTFLAGEKYLNTNHYDSRAGPGDQHSAYTGACIENYRWTGVDGNVVLQPPIQDIPGFWVFGVSNPFGSAHSNGFQMAFCDGSVHTMSYSIDLEIYRRLGNRKDGLPIDGKAY